MEDVGSYQYLTNGNLPCAGQDDQEMYSQLLEAFNIMAITRDEQAAIHRTLSSILLLGNMQFKQERNSDQATLPDNTVAQKACHLMGLSVTELTKAFLKPRIKVGRDYVTKAQTKEQVEYAVEAISKTIYEKMFRWLVARINRALDRTKRQGASFIGILDIAGFEIFQVSPQSWAQRPCTGPLPLSPLCLEAREGCAASVSLLMLSAELNSCFSLIEPRANRCSGVFHPLRIKLMR